MIRTFSREAYEETIKIADMVADSGLDFTLVRAPRLVDKPATGNLYVGPRNEKMKSTLSRQDYTAFLVAQVEDESLIGQMPVLSDK